MATSLGLLLLVTMMISTYATLCHASPQSEPQSNMAAQGGGVMGGGQPMRPNDFWNWRSNPAYGDYWQREMARRQWAQRAPGAPGGYYPGATAGPDSQYTYKTYDNPEFYGYDSVFPGGRAHFIGYRTQGGKKTPSDWSQDQNMKRPSYSSVTQPTYPSNPQQNFKRK